MAPYGGATIVSSPGISSLFNSHLYSDLKIRCKDGTTFVAHKAIVCAQSCVLANACDPENAVKVAQNGVTDVSEDDPAIIEGLLRYLYHKDYLEPTPESALAFHVRMHAAGDYYQVPDLKDLAKKRFQDLIMQEDGWKDPSLMEVIIRIYNSTAPNDQDLRGVVVSVAQKHFGELQQNPNFVDVSDGFGQFSMDLAKAFYAKSASNEESTVRTKKKYQCRWCSGLVKLELSALPPDTSYIPCPGCGCSYSKEIWEGRVVYPTDYPVDQVID